MSHLVSCIKIFRLSLNSTKVGDQGLTNLGNFLSNLEALQDLRVELCSIRKKRIITKIFPNTKKSTRNIKKLTLSIANTPTKDSDIDNLIELIHSILTNMEVFKLRIKSTNVTAQSIDKLNYAIEKSRSIGRWEIAKD